MANTNGGTIYIGLSTDVKEKITGVREPTKAIKDLQSAVSQHLTPDPAITIDSLVSQGQTVVRIIVPPGKELPYAIDDNRFYVRDDTETTLAVRDEIVRLVERRLLGEVHFASRHTPDESPVEVKPATVEAPVVKPPKQGVQGTAPPRTGVEIVATENRDGTLYHTVRDLRNGNLIKNVTRKSARKLWHYAITQAEAGIPKAEQLEWHGNKAFLEQRSKDNYVWYDLAMRENGELHIFYGVTDSGLNDDWMSLVQKYT